MRFLVAKSPRTNSGHNREAGDVIARVADDYAMGVQEAKHCILVDVVGATETDFEALMLPGKNRHRGYSFKSSALVHAKKNQDVFDEDGNVVGTQEVDDIAAPVVLNFSDLEERDGLPSAASDVARANWVAHRKQEIADEEAAAAAQPDTGPGPGPLFVAIVPVDPRIEGDVEIPQNGVVIRRRSSANAIEEWPGLWPDDAMSAELAIIDQHGGRVWDA